MIYQYVKRYLKNEFGVAKSDITWSYLDDVKFFNHIGLRYTNDEFVKNLSEVKEAFKDFFEPIGTIIFRYKIETGIKFKLFPYRVEPCNSKHLNELVKIIHKNRKYVKYPYKEQDDQIGILGKIRREINLEINDTDESVNKKELIKFAIRKALELNDKDIIIQLKRVLIIKIFDSSKISKLDDEENEIIEDSRFNGYTQEQVEETYKEIFSKANIDTFLQNIMNEIFVEKLNFTTITNKYYEQNALKFILNKITLRISEYVSLEEDFLKGISSYILKLHIRQIHKIIATKLLEEVHNKNQNAEDFLLYYNGKVVVEHGKRYKIPSLVTPDGKQWNNSSIVGICALWINAKNKKESYEKMLIDIDKKTLDKSKILSSVELEKQNLIDSKEKCEVEQSSLMDKSKKMQAKLMSHVRNGLGNRTEESKIKRNIESYQNKMNQLQEEIKNINHELSVIDDENRDSYDDVRLYTEQKNKLLQAIKGYEQNLNSNSGKLNGILESLINALMSRRKLLKN